MIYLTEFGLLLGPTVTLVGFLVSLFMYIYAKKKNKRAPESYSEASLKVRKTALVVFSVISAVMLAAIAALVILLYTAVAYM